eukprot:1179640-Prorocentrum_minimum.AAC.4
MPAARANRAKGPPPRGGEGPPHRAASRTNGRRIYSPRKESITRAYYAASRAEGRPAQPGTAQKRELKPFASGAPAGHQRGTSGAPAGRVRTAP